MASFHPLRGRRGLFAVLAAAAVAVPTGSAAVAAPSNAAPSSAAPSNAAPSSAVVVAAADQTSALERKRVDSVPTPNLRWYSCDGGTDRCTTVWLPVDYDKPTGAKIKLAVYKVPAAKPDQKIGTLFVNPGGPGGSAVELAASAPVFFSQSVLDRFDIVGVDPRGVGYSTLPRCFRDRDRQAAVLGLANFAFPSTADQIDRARRSATLFARACGDYGAPVINSMSTAQYARDLDVMRRAVGDETLTYFGIQYGTVVGQTYANMFPDRVRAVAIDGVDDAARWYGSTPALAEQPPTGRILAGEASYDTFVEFLRRCDAAGPTVCAFGGGDALAAWRTLLTDLETDPVDLGGGYIVSSDSLVGEVGAMMSDSGSVEAIPDFLLEIRGVLDARGVTRADLAARLTRTLASLRQGKSGGRAGVPYDSAKESYYGVLCSDARSPASTQAWVDAVAQSQKRAPDFGLLWLWKSAQCARDNWTALDEDAYRGPLNRTTATPLLVLGNTYSPETNVRNASAVAARMKAGLVLSDSWGAVVYGSSVCATTPVDDYLLSQKVPTATVRCVGDVQPFAGGDAGKKVAEVPGLGSPVGLLARS